MAIMLSGGRGEIKDFSADDRDRYIRTLVINGHHEPIFDFIERGPDKNYILPYHNGLMCGSEQKGPPNDVPQATSVMQLLL